MYVCMYVCIYVKSFLDGMGTEGEVVYSESVNKCKMVDLTALYTTQYLPIVLLLQC
jgi:hypothetical protein